MTNTLQPKGTMNPKETKQKSSKLENIAKSAISDFNKEPQSKAIPSKASAASPKLVAKSSLAKEGKSAMAPTPTSPNGKKEEKTARSQLTTAMSEKGLSKIADSPVSSKASETTARSQMPILPEVGREEGNGAVMPAAKPKTAAPGLVSVQKEFGKVQDPPNGKDKDKTPPSAATVSIPHHPHAV